jgi:putative membrane protein
VLQVSETLSDILRRGWDIHPTLLATVLALALGYFIGIANGITRGQRRFPTGRVLAFTSAVAMLLLALHSPLHHLADEFLFSAHMAQHLVLTLFIPPLLLIGTPDWVVRPLVDRPVIREAAHSRLYPVVAFALFNVVFAFIHFPVLYDGAFGSEVTHRATHLALLGTALLTWLPLASPIPDVIPRLSPPAQMLYCFLQTIPGGIVGALLSFVDWVMYRHYGVKPMLLGVDPASDQQLGGLLMWVVGGTYYLLILTVIFFIWADREERTAYGGEGGGLIGRGPQAASSAGGAPAARRQS